VTALAAAQQEAGILQRTLDTALQISRAEGGVDKRDFAHFDSSIDSRYFNRFEGAAALSRLNRSMFVAKAICTNGFTAAGPQCDPTSTFR
jgi:hypothetical protein